MRQWRVPFPKFGAGPGLERTAAVAAKLGLDLARFGASGAVIVGTNGKGSTAAMTAALLQQTGASVGLFTSPHLFELNERFRCDGEDIFDDELKHHWERVVDAARAAGRETQLGGFEFLFLIAADWFAARGCAHTVWEAGIGGRYDPVRLIEARRVALTSLDLEHTQLLGATLEEIARDKLDAAPKGAKAFIGASCSRLRDTIAAHCGALGVRPVFDAPQTAAPATLPGEHQGANASLALALARDIAGPALTPEMIKQGFEAVRWPGRLEVLEDEPLVVIDVGHTPEAVRAALAGFNAMRADCAGVLVCGASHDKDVSALIGELARGGFIEIICTTAAHKGAPAAHVAACAQAAEPGAEIVVAESVAEAHRLALTTARRRHAAAYVAGGLFLAAEFKAVHLGRDPAGLVFF